MSDTGFGLGPSAGILPGFDDRIVPMNLRWLLLLLCPVLTWAAEPVASENASGQAIDQVLALGPLPLSTALLADADKADEIQRAAIMQLRSTGLPSAGQGVTLFGQSMRWQRLEPSATSAGEALSLWVVQLETGRHVEGRLQLDGLDKVKAWLDGVTTPVKDNALELKLPTGSHSLWLLHRGSTGDTPPALRWHGKAAHDRLRSHTEPALRVSARHLTNARTVQRLAISPDGRRLAIASRGRDDSANADLERLEIRDVDSGRIVEQWPGPLPSELAWSPDGRWLAVRQGKQLWLRDLEGGPGRPILAEHEHIGAWRWHSDSRSILFLWTQPFDAKDARVRRLRGLEDRWRTFRDNAQLHQVDVDSGLIRPLTALDSSVTVHDLAPDGDRVLLSHRLQDYAEPPHALFQLFELRLSSLARRDIAQLRQLNGAAFADEGYWLIAGPGLTQGDGGMLDDDLVANDYDGQLFRLSSDGQRATSLSRAFHPAIGGLSRLRNGDLLLPVTEGDRALLYRYRVGGNRFERIDTGLDVLEGHVVSGGQRSSLAVYGSDAAAPQRVHVVDLERNRHRVLIDSARSDYAQVRLGEVRDWHFSNRDGDEIDGRYYLPPDFDASRRYPMIVYYYGGTTPVNRQFTGRYPFHLWAANGYVVYVLQPRGTIGYGQRVSALHVNAWGRYAADDIVDGTRAFLAEHEFIDPQRVGNIGASYGGFMTMYVATQTDLFAASVSHAGISHLTAYWGQGWWGYGYSGIASRGSFPWNNPELYVGQSPVYHADRITTPLLLLTGDADTNVPPGESHSMYTALTLLGREVELVEVPGEDHHILDREKRYVWWDQILAWFDRWLKDEPQWWHALHPETAP